MRYELFIRTDGNKRIGHGHLVRCLALAQILNKNYRITFVCRQIPDKIEADVLQKGFKLYKIYSESDFLQRLTPESIVVIDGYYFDSNYQYRIKKIGCKLVCIDDLYDREFFADLIINHSQGVKKEDYRAQAYTKFALGLEYALLRPTFLEEAKNEREIETIETVLICCGGSDPRNFSEKILNVVLEFGEFKKILMITGEGYSHTDQIQKIANEDNRVDHHIAINEEEMRDLMVKADLAIIPTSSMIMEAVCCSCNILCFWYVKDQETFHNYITKNNFVESFGDNSLQFRKNEMKVSLKKIIQNQSSGNHEALINKLSNVKKNLNNKFKSILE